MSTGVADGFVATQVIVSSDEARRACGAAANAPGHRAEFEARLASALVGDETLVLFNKNVPTEDALGGACKQIMARSDGCEVTLVLVAPTTLDPERCWERVRARGADDVALNVHEAKNARQVLDGLFVPRCAETLARLDGSVLGDHAIRSDAFWGPRGAGR